MWYNIAIVGWGAKEGKKYYKIIMLSLMAMKIAELLGVSIILTITTIISIHEH